MATFLTGRSTRNEILLLLRRRDGTTAEEIAAELGLTPNAVRQHLTNLEREELVTNRPFRDSGRGRPALRFSLTERADATFPKRYGQLATMILTELNEMGGPQMIDEVIGRIAARRARHIEADIEGLDFDGKLEKVVAWIGRAGTLTECIERDGAVLVTIRNCPFRNTALKFPQVCAITPHLLTQLMNTSVTQENSIHRRDPYCSFLVQRPESPLPE